MCVCVCVCVHLLLLFLGRHLEGMRELEILISFDKSDVNLCSSMLQIHAHRLCETVGKMK